MFSHVLRKIWLISGKPVASGGETQLRAGDRHWHVLPQGMEIFGPEGPDLERWIADGSAELIKSGQQRTIYRVTLDSAVVFVKRCRVNGFRAWWREVLRPAKARLEFENAVTLRKLGMPAVEPLAWGFRSHWFPGESFFVTRAQGDGESLQRFLDHTYPALPPERQRWLRPRLAVALGILMARLHDAGVAHPDPHPGNLLVELTSQGHHRFTLIDLHAVHFGAPLSRGESLENLVLMNRWFQLRASRSDRMRFWSAYVEHRTTLPSTCPVELAAMARDVELRTEQSNARFWNSRFPRYRKTNRQFYRVSAPTLKGHSVRELPDVMVRRLTQDPDAPFRDPASRVLKDSRSSTVVEFVIHTPTGPKPVIYKRFRVKSLLVRLKNLLRTSAAMRSWLYGHNLIDRGLPTPRPLLLLERKGFLGFFGTQEGYLLTEKVPDAWSLSDAMKQCEQMDPAQRRRVILKYAPMLGELLRLVHNRKVTHRDLKGPNILLEGASLDPESPTPMLIDLVGVQPGCTVPTFHQRIRNLARLNVSFLHNTFVSRSDRLRFLRAYLSWGLHGREGWKVWWKAIEKQSEWKVAKNQRSGRPLY